MITNIIVCNGANHFGIKPTINYISEKFANGEQHIEILDSVREQHIIILQSFKDPSYHLMELMIMSDAVRRSGAKKITLFLPLFPYSRQDRRHTSGTPVSAKVICDMLKCVNVDRLITFDLHADQIQGMINSRIQFDHISTRMFFKHYLEQEFEDLSSWTFCSPDAGSIKRTKALGGKLGAKSYCLINKVRSAPNQIDSMEVIGDVHGQNVCLVDDMIDTGGTLNCAMNILKDFGANRVIAVATHGILSNAAVEKLKSQEIYLSDSVPIYVRHENLIVFPLKIFIEDIIERIKRNKGLSPFFDFWPLH